MSKARYLIVGAITAATVFPLVSVFAIDSSSPPDIQALIIENNKKRSALRAAANNTAGQTTSNPLPENSNMQINNTSETVNVDLDPAATGTAVLEEAQKPLTATEIKAKKDAVIAKKELLNAQKCRKVEGKVAIQVSKFESNLKRRAAWHNRFANRVNNIISKYKAEGYDTTKLEADLIELNKLQDVFVTDKTAYISLLKQSRLYVCTKSEGEIKASLIDVREALKKVKASDLAVKDYYRNTIRVDILALTKK